MARVVSGPYLGYSGTVDGMTYYQINGITYVKKKNTKSTKPRTENQEAQNVTLTMISKFLKPFDDFVKFSYQHVAKSKGMNPHNAIANHIWENALQGRDMNRSVDLQQLLITQGNLPAAKTQKVEMTEKGLKFTWSNEIEEGKSHHSDQVVLLAYFPELEEVVYKIGGAERGVGEQLLPLIGVEQGYEAEIFISFVTNDHSDMANSIYLGKLNW